MNTIPSQLYYIKFGGSLITNKHEECTANLDVIDHLSSELAVYVNNNPHQNIILGHGAGSFGHIQAIKNQISGKINNQSTWNGALEVAKAVSSLTRLLELRLIHAGLKVVTYHPSSTAQCDSGRLLHMSTSPIFTALKQNAIPLIHGDICFDKKYGASIISTEEIFKYLSTLLPPDKIYLAGIDQGVYSSYPHGTLVQSISSTYNISLNNISESTSPDITGGMESKVKFMQNIIKRNPSISAYIFSAKHPGELTSALDPQQNPGTVICQQNDMRIT
ncbi:MAG: hypothetical protein CMQ51_00875 [Gammaproteobacteria bacterium]|nr:hypothetical protein [Gammaproteobacteria bacterium]|tara:strand:+ start:128 stop:955 length:828 start_codon:yes stop_codon:yes gene_type:complete